MGEDFIERARARHLSAYLTACLSVEKLPPAPASRLRMMIYRVRIGAMGMDRFDMRKELAKLAEHAQDARGAREPIFRYIQETRRLLTITEGSVLDAFLAEISEADRG